MKKEKNKGREEVIFIGPFYELNNKLEMYTFRKQRILKN